MKACLTGDANTVLIVGGNGAQYIESYDPVTESFSPAGQMSTYTLLDNGKVLVAGGQDQDIVLDTAELYDPATGTFSPAGSMTAARANHTATPLPNRKVLFVGWNDRAPSAELYFY